MIERKCLLGDTCHEHVVWEQRHLRVYDENISFHQKLGASDAH
jgi:hypothetical protein